MSNYKFGTNHNLSLIFQPYTSGTNVISNYGNVNIDLNSIFQPYGGFTINQAAVTGYTINGKDLNTYYLKINPTVVTDNSILFSSTTGTNFPTVKTSNGYSYLFFSSTGNYSFTPNFTNTTANYLVVGGGGGGGKGSGTSGAFTSGGGGGGGGFSKGTTQLTNGTINNITVGSGGASNAGTYSGAGSSSIFNSTTVPGGNGGTNSNGTGSGNPASSGSGNPNGGGGFDGWSVTSAGPGIKGTLYNGTSYYWGGGGGSGNASQYQQDGDGGSGGGGAGAGGVFGSGGITNGGSSTNSGGIGGANTGGGGRWRSHCIRKWWSWWFWLCNNLVAKFVLVINFQFTKSHTTVP